MTSLLTPGSSVPYHPSLRRALSSAVSPVPGTGLVPGVGGSKRGEKEASSYEEQRYEV